MPLLMVGQSQRCREETRHPEAESFTFGGHEVPRKEGAGGKTVVPVADGCLVHGWVGLRAEARSRSEAAFL